MVIKCQHSGLEFNSERNRKMHPLVAEFKNSRDLVKNHQYRLAVEALDEAAQQPDAYTTIEDYLVIVRRLFTEKVAAQTRAIETRQMERIEAVEDQAKAKEARDKQNELLWEHGYRWQKHYVDHLDHYEEPLDDDEFVWVLVAPDGRYDIPVKQALDEIERGADVVLEEIRIKTEQAANREKQAQLAEQVRLEQDRQRRLAFEENLKGLTYVSAAYIGPYTNLGEKVSFATGWYTTGDTYYRISTPHGTGFLKEFGNTTVAYVPNETAVEWFRASWTKRQSPEHALASLSGWLRNRGEGVYGAEYQAWLVENVGIETLVQIARSGVIEIEQGHAYSYGLASKFYRVPLVYKSADGKETIGYGNIQSSGKGPDSWLPLEAAESYGEWPTEKDMEKEHERAAESSQLFRDFFGD